MIDRRRRLRPLVFPLLVLFSAAPAAQYNESTTTQVGKVNINRTYQCGDENLNSTYQEGKVNINRTVQTCGKGAQGRGQGGLRGKAQDWAQHRRAKDASAPAAKGERRR